MSSLDTVPARVQQGPGEIWRREIDFKPNLRGGETIIGSTATLTDVATGIQNPAGIGPVTNTDTVVTVQVQAIASGVTYELLVTATVSATKVMQARLLIDGVG